MNEGIVFYNDRKLHLDTSMSQSAFAKSRMSDRLNEKGFLAEYKDNSWIFSDWNFKESFLSQCYDENISAAERAVKEKVLLQGSAFEGQTLKAIFDLEEQNNFSEKSRIEASLAANSVCSAIENAIEKNINLSNNGAEGIFISSDLNKIIFLPQDLFENIASCFGDENYSKFEGIYVYRNLDGKAALRFTECVIAYRAIANKFPFSNLNTEKRQEDFQDHNYIKLSAEVYGINEKLSFFIDNALMRSPKIESHKKASLADKRSLNEKITSSVKEGIVKERNELQEKKAQMAGMKFPLQLFRAELGLEENGSLPASKKLNSTERKMSISKEQFNSQTKKSFETFTKSLNTKRWLRHNKSTLSVVFLTALLVFIISFSLWNTKQENPTTIGLTSTQTAEMFYSAMNNLDVASAQTCVKGKSMSEKVDVISNFYVTSKSRSAYDQKYNCVPLSSWLCFNNNGTYTIFGLSQFTVDGMPASLDMQGPSKKTHPTPLKSENGKVLLNKDKIQHKVNYNLVYTEGISDITILNYNDTITLTWTNNRWIVTNMEQTCTQSAAPISEFIKDYKSTFENNGNDAVKAGASLSEKYSWISTEQEIIESKKKLEENQ